MTSLDTLAADMRAAIKAAQDCPVEQFEAYRSDFRSICTIGNVSRILDALKERDDALAAERARAEAAEREAAALRDLRKAVIREALTWYLHPSQRDGKRDAALLSADDETGKHPSPHPHDAGLRRG